jgi:hypothetical protein
VRASLVIGLFAAVLAGCGTSGSALPDAHVNKCVDRLLVRAETSGGSVQQLRRYTKGTYCARFAQNGWVYDDGALSIAAQKWLDNAGTCTKISSDEPAHEVPCEKANREPATGTIDCALLHNVRRAEVVTYVAELERDGDVQCDDGTPLDELGVP